MGKKQVCLCLCVLLQLQFAQASSFGEKFKEAFARLNEKSAHALARRFWPRLYGREIKEWSQLAAACEKAPDLVARAENLGRQGRMIASPSGNAPKNFQLVYYSAADRAVLAAKDNLRQNLLKKFDLHYKKIQSAIAYERYWARDPVAKFAVSRVDHLVSNSGARVRSAIAREEYQRCGAILRDIIGHNGRG